MTGLIIQNGPLCSLPKLRAINLLLTPICGAEIALPKPFSCLNCIISHRGCLMRCEWYFERGREIDYFFKCLLKALPLLNEVKIIYIFNLCRHLPESWITYKQHTGGGDLLGSLHLVCTCNSMQYRDPKNWSINAPNPLTCKATTGPGMLCLINKNNFSWAFVLLFFFVVVKKVPILHLPDRSGLIWNYLENNSESINVSLFSSAGRALDWRSKGRWFKPGKRHSFFVEKSKKTPSLMSGAMHLHISLCV